MELSDFEYRLPPERIASVPLAERDASRMMVLDCRARSWRDGWFRELPESLRGDELVVVNNARVIPARLFGRRLGVRSEPAGRARSEFLKATIEVLLVRRLGADRWEALVRPGRKVRIGERIVFGEGIEAEVVGRGSFGERELQFSCAGPLEAALERVGHVPLPPYIRRADQPLDRERYQTIFARTGAAVAAPTAALHFTPALVSRLQERGIELAELTLEIGLGTFQPIHCARIENHRMHRESYQIPAATATAVARARRDRRPVLAVGTTVVRALEDAACRHAGRLPATMGTSRGEGAGDGPIDPGAAEAELFIYPGYRFRVVDQLLTNFHLPRSSLLVMVAAFAGREFLLDAYRHAVDTCYRFYSYGDCMLIR